MPESALEKRLESLEWSEHLHRLNDKGYTVLKNLVPADVCTRLIEMYPQAERFRSVINMGKYGFGSGEYKYLCYPLPAPVAALRAQVYARLVPLANYWNRNLRIDLEYPPSLESFIAVCNGLGQARPTPLLLRYASGDYNCLHRDLYGEVSFPVQMVILLSEPGSDFIGGEFVITEQRPRMQSRASVMPLAKGDALLFSVNRRPVKGARGFYSVFTRHGVSEVLSGERFSLGLIFHDAQ